ncbi:cytochrome C biogenesis protein CycK [Thalassospira profundimaris]|uniref:Cytochrome C biogenesis protein CycK n=1 Tax=Thalassospira profundimaris TaxID=502049 RepID=A0A367X056_9PROT|nr:cytochrome c-type biogenesis CcmF C-terminal domain-containing protein [Thalassospira profundimaris]RCK47066.1 cytochrome C biogenesis protein CycK [Thalassospira profundimaris]
MIAETGHFALILLMMLAFCQAILFSPLGIVFRRGSLGLRNTAHLQTAGGVSSLDTGGQHGFWHHFSSALLTPGAVRISPGASLSPMPLWPLPVLICLLALGAQASQIYSFVTSDFTLAMVAQYSHSSTPLMYRIAAAISPDCGATLLWVTLTSSAAILFLIQNAIFKKAENPQAIVSVMGLVVGLLAASVLIDGTPFARLAAPPLDGQGFDPQSQDILDLFYSPALYAGLSGLSVIFAATIAALPRAALHRAWAEMLRPWTLISWTLLGAAMAISAYRAYSQQSWGNWWYWDASENAVLLPWLLATAFLHCLAVLEKTEALKPWTALLALSAFGAGWFGTFLSRSDLLGPLPAALRSSGDNAVLLVGFCVLFAGAYYLFARVAGQLRENADFTLVSRESAMFINSVMLAVAAAIVLIGTVYPLFLRWLGGTIITVGPPFFVQALMPVTLAMLLLMGLSPTLRWRVDGAASVGRRMKLALILSIIVTLFVWMRHIDAPSLPLLGIGLAAWVVTAALGDLWEKLWRHRDHGESKYRNIQLLGPRYLGMSLAHIGMALLIAGGSASSIWEEQSVLSARTGQSIEIGPYNLQYEGVSLLPGENFATRKAKFIVYRNAQPVTELYPEVRYYPIRGVETKESAIWHGRDGDLHVSIGDRAEDSGRIVDVRFLPMMPWVWAGMLLILLGGIINVLTRMILLFKKNGVSAP